MANRAAMQSGLMHCLWHGARAGACLLLWATLLGPAALGPAASNRGGSQAGREASARPARALPFNAWDVIEFLSGNFQIQPEEVRPGHFILRFSESRMAVLRSEPIRMEVSSQDGRLDVTFSFQEFNAMHYVAEFMECRLFTRAEAEQLYALLYDPKGPAWRRLGRFRARAEFVRSPGGMQARFSFAPLEG